jgi:hypothetical protein
MVLLFLLLVRAPFTLPVFMCRLSHVPQLHLQLFSAGQITDHGCRVILDSDTCPIQDRRTGTLVGSGRRLRDPPHHWELDWLHLPPASTSRQLTPAADVTPFVVSTSTSFAQWHHRLGHMCGSRLSSFVTSGALGKVTSDTSLPCMSCRLGKQIQLPYSISQTVSTRPFDHIHSDVWGPAPFVSKGGHCYYMIFIDDFSHFTWIYFLETQAQVLTMIVRTQYDSSIRVFCANSTREYLSHSLRHFLSEQGTLP